VLKKKSIINVNTEEASKEASSGTAKGICPDCGYLDVFPVNFITDSILVKCKRCLKDFKVFSSDSKRIKK